MTDYKDMLTMQKEAKQRVIEMQRRSKFAADSFNNSNRTIKNEADEENLPRIARAISYPTEITKQKTTVASDNNTDRHKTDIRLRLKSLLKNITGEDSERLLIMSLCMLLANEENTDEGLIIALMYLLT